MNEQYGECNNFRAKILGDKVFGTVSMTMSCNLQSDKDENDSEAEWHGNAHKQNWEHCSAEFLLFWTALWEMNASEQKQKKKKKKILPGSWNQFLYGKHSACRSRGLQARRREHPAKNQSNCRNLFRTWTNNGHRRQQWWCALKNDCENMANHTWKFLIFKEGKRKKKKRKTLRLGEPVVDW